MVAAPPRSHQRIRLPEWSDPFTRPARYKSAKGGRGSSKSHTFAQLAILRMANLLPDYPPGPVRIASARDFETSIKESVKIAIETYIRNYGLSDEFIVKQYEIDHKNGSHMFFPGVNRKVESFLSVEDLDVLWIEQAEFLEDEMETVVPSVRKPGSELWFSWNPLERTTWCWNRFVNNPRDGDVLAHVNYYDNPWWYPHCQTCKTYYPWHERERDCCGDRIWPGLWELEQERAAFQIEEPERYGHVYLGHPNDNSDSAIIPYATWETCIEAYKLGYAPKPQHHGIVDAGLDVAEGGQDKCALVIRRGPVVTFLDVWPGVRGDTSLAAARAWQGNEVHGPVMRIYYDAASTIRTDLIRAGFNGGGMVRPVNFGGKVQGEDYDYERGRPNGATFARRNIQMADALRLRANRTVRLLKGADVDPMRCLFIPPDLAPRMENVLAELSQPTRRLNISSGRWEIEKASVDERSPDIFDALCLAFARETDGRGLRAR